MNCAAGNGTLIGKKRLNTDAEEEGDTNDDPCFSARGRSSSKTSSSFSTRSGSSTSLILSIVNERRGWPLT